jgi:hypothetical protein
MNRRQCKIREAVILIEIEILSRLGRKFSSNKPEMSYDIGYNRRAPTASLAAIILQRLGLTRVKI